MTNYIDQYNAFVETLEDIFMMDHEELDFGIYRIMNYKRDEIKDFLKNRLLNQVDEILAKNVGGDQLVLETELDTQLGTLERGFGTYHETSRKDEAFPSTCRVEERRV